MHSQRLKIELMPVSLVSQEAGFWQGNRLFFLKDYMFLHCSVWASPQVDFSTVSDREL